MRTLSRARALTLALPAFTLAMLGGMPAARAQATATPPAQGPTLPAETVKASTATKGNTEIAKGGFVTGALPADADAKDATEASIAAGGLFSSGNARTVALTSIGKLRLRRDEHQVTIAATANFARAGKAGEKVETAVENYQGLLRYDYFFTNEVAVFLQSTARRDRFQGLDLRLNVDPGVAYYAINTKKQVLRGELGYDLQHDVRRDADRDLPVPAGAPAGTLAEVVPKTETLHNARAFVGYENKLYAQVAFVTGLEYLQNFSDFDKYRLVFDVGLKSNISDKLAIATTYTMRYENKPLPKVENADSIASVNLVYTLF
jgi:putative salt-induced outer membrane protein